MHATPTISIAALPMGKLNDFIFTLKKKKIQCNQVIWFIWDVIVRLVAKTDCNNMKLRAQRYKTCTFTSSCHSLWIQTEKGERKNYYYHKSSAKLWFMNAIQQINCHFAINVMMTRSLIEMLSITRVHAAFAVLPVIFKCVKWKWQIVNRMKKENTHQSLGVLLNNHRLLLLSQMIHTVVLNLFIANESVWHYTATASIFRYRKKKNNVNCVLLMTKFMKN